MRLGRPVRKTKRWEKEMRRNWMLTLAAFSALVLVWSLACHADPATAEAPKAPDGNAAPKCCPADAGAKCSAAKGKCCPADAGAKCCAGKGKCCPADAGAKCSAAKGKCCSADAGAKCCAGKGKCCDSTTKQRGMRSPCRPRPSGNMPAAPAVRENTVSGTTSRCWANMPGVK